MWHFSLLKSICHSTSLSVVSPQVTPDSWPPSCRLWAWAGQSWPHQQPYQCCWWRVRPSTIPWGSPESTWAHSEASSLRNTLCFLSSSHILIQSSTFPSNLSPLNFSKLRSVLLSSSSFHPSQISISQKCRTHFLYYVGVVEGSWGLHFTQEKQCGMASFSFFSGTGSSHSALKTELNILPFALLLIFP